MRGKYLQPTGSTTPLSWPKIFVTRMLTRGLFVVANFYSLLWGYTFVRTNKPNS